jgi:hypothetical protein
MGVPALSTGSTIRQVLFHIILAVNLNYWALWVGDKF